MDTNETLKLFRIAVKKAIEDDRLDFSDHAHEMMGKRGITEKDVRKVILENDPHEFFPPYKYPYGENPFTNRDPVFITMAENYLVAVVAMKRKKAEIRFQVVTAFFASEQSRHRKRRKPPLH